MFKYRECDVANHPYIRREQDFSLWNMAWLVQKVYSARENSVYHVDKLDVCANDLKLSEVNC